MGRRFQFLPTSTCLLLGIRLREERAPFISDSGYVCLWFTVPGVRSSSRPWLGVFLWLFFCSPWLTRSRAGVEASSMVSLTGVKNMEQTLIMALLKALELHLAGK